MIKSYSPTAKLITRAKLRQEIVTLSDDIRKNAIEIIAGAKLNITLDHWTPKNGNSNFVGMTASWISDKWEKKSCTLGMCLHTGTSKGSDIFDKLLTDMTKYVKENATVFAVTSDTTGNMNKFGQILEEGNVHHCYCTDHVLNLTCGLLYKKIKRR